MGIKNSVIAGRIEKRYNQAKDMLGNNAVDSKLKASHAKRAAVLDNKGTEIEKASVRKKLGVSASTYESIRSAGPEQGYIAKDAKHAERLYDRAVGGGKSDTRYLSSASIHREGETLVKNTYGMGTAALQSQLKQATLGAIADAPLNASQKAAASALATGLINSMKVEHNAHTDKKEIHFAPPSKNFRQTAEEQKGKRNTVQRFVDRKTDKLTATAGLLSKKVTTVTGHARQLGNEAARKAYNATTSAVAGTAVGLAATAVVASAPATVPGKVAWNMGRGVVKGLKEAGKSVAKRTSEDAKKLGKEFSARNKKS